jgi:hypothetical protein
MSATPKPPRLPLGTPDEEVFDDLPPETRGGLPEPVSYPEASDDAGPDGLSDDPPD